MTVRAYAPGSVTTVFVPREDEAGSLGVSFAIEDGVTVAVTPGASSQVTLAGEPTSFEPVEQLLEELGVQASVAIESDVPVGRGFGASGAATLATGLATVAAFDLQLERSEILQRAHQAELSAGTGQGDVFVQAQGGLVWNTGEGIGRLERRDPISYTSFSGIATSEILGDDETIETITVAGREALAAFDPEMPLEEWVSTAWDFATRTGLVTETITEAVETVEAGGGSATMAMIGETVIGTGGGGSFEQTTAITPEGACLLD